MDESADWTESMNQSTKWKHYRPEMQPQAVTDQAQTEQLGQTTALNGKSYLPLFALKDMSNKKFIRKLNDAANAPDIKVCVGSYFQ